MRLQQARAQAHRKLAQHCFLTCLVMDGLMRLVLGEIAFPSLCFF